MNKHIVLVTSAQPSANPRLLKEAIAIYKAGFETTVIWCPISPWADEFDKQLFNEFPTIKWIKAGFHSQYQPFGYWYARVRQKYWLLIYKLIGNHFDASVKSVVLYSQELNSIALLKKADIYIGHNLGALPAIVKAATKYNSKSIFDFEDFHRGEDAVGSLQTRFVKEIEAKYIPFVDNVTTASSAITLAYQTIFPNKNITTINNCFSLSYAIEFLQKIPDRPLKLFWFSQYVGKQRGLQTVIKAMSNFKSDVITLTLLGKATDEVKEYFYALMDEVGLIKSQVAFLDPVQESEIVQIASQHHIGVASEYSHNINRDLCLTNKIFMYLLAGHALVLSDTYAQSAFLNENPSIGSLYKQNSLEELTSVLKSYLRDSHLLLFHRQNALELAKAKYNWNIEKKKFLQNVEQVLAK